MGIRGELFSTRMTCEGRTYFFNVKQNRMGDVFLTIVESKPTEAETFDRRSIVVFKEDMRGFLKAFQTTLNYLEKSGGKAPTEMSFSPEAEESFEDFQARRAPSPEGEKKRRVVVKRRPAAGEGAKPEGGAPS